jgi:FKBP-type peptidyl-prolyl cis-trans isomerase
MKSTYLILALSLALSGAASLRAQEVKLPSAAPAQPQFTEAQLLETLGWFIAKQNGFSELGFTKEQIDELVKGVYLATAGKDAPYNLDAIGPEIGKFMQGKQQAYMDKIKAQGQAESEKFLAEIKAKSGVVTLPSGLAYETVKPGTGPFPKATDMVKVHYTGTLVNGTKFDSSVDRGEPFETSLKDVIPGWTEGIQKVNTGGKIKLYVPSNLAYGEQGHSGIPPNSALIFDVELLEIKSAAAPAAVPPPAK